MFAASVDARATATRDVASTDKGWMGDGWRARLAPGRRVRSSTPRRDARAVGGTGEGIGGDDGAARAWTRDWGGGVDGKGAWEGDDDSRGRAPGRDGRRTGAKAERRPRAATGGRVGEDDSWVHLTRTGGTSDLWDEAAADEEAERAPAFDEDADAFVDTPERARALDSALKGLVSRDGRVTYGLKPLHGRLLTAKIKELGNAKRLDAVFQLLDMSAIPTTPNGRKITIGAVIGACVKCEDLDTAYRLLMKLDGPEECGAGAPAYSALMLGYARQGRLIEALGLLEQWERGRGPKDAKFGVGKRGNIILRGSWRWSKEDVPKFPKRDEMGTRWYPRRAATTRMLFAALDACATCGDVRRTRRFMKRIMKWEGRVQNATNFNEDEYLWNALIKATARGKDPLSCLNVLNEMNKAGVLPTRVTYNIVISACAKGGRPDWCRALLRKMYILKDKNCRPDAVSYTTTLVAETAAAQGVVGAGAEFAGGVEVVKSLWNNFIKKNVKQDGVVIGAFVNAFVANSDIENALHALDHGYAANVYISPSVYFTAMRFLASKGDEDGVKRLGNKLRAKNASGEIAAEIDMFEAEACAAAGNVEGARAAIFRVQNGNEAAAAKVFRDRSSGVLVALFVQEVLECDVGENVSERAQATESFDEDDEEEYDDLTMLDSETILNHNGSLCRWEKPDVWSVTQALDLLDGAWSYDEFDEQGIGESPAPPPRGGWAQAVQSHAVEPLLFKNGVSPSEPIGTVVPEIALCMRRGDIVRRSDSVSDAIQSLGANFNAVVIDDDTGIPVGTFRRADADVGPGITVGQVMSAGPERLFRDDTTVADVAMLCVRDSAALVAIVDEEGRIVGTLRQDDILIPAREESASPR